MSSNNFGTIGVMVCRRIGSPPFAEKEYLRELSLASSRFGMSVFVFFPEDKPDSATLNHQISGYIYKRDGWVKETFPIPDIIYDRCLFKNVKETSVAASFLGGLPETTWSMWSRGLPGKRRVYDLLKREQALSPFLPHTLSYTGSKSLSKAIDLFDGELFMKPSGGSHGRHTLYVNCKRADETILQGRDRSNSIFQKTILARDLFHWVNNFTGRRRFIIQPYLKLSSREGSPFDLRVLAQKNARGRWTTTGMAVRQGPAEGKTSNLHGGGTAMSAPSFLESEFGVSLAGEIIACINHLSECIPPLLENGFGRLGELGIDFGIDCSGKVWLLEVNSKPGRRVFRQTGDIPAAKLSVENPLRYARYLLLRQLRRVNT